MIYKHDIDTIESEEIRVRLSRKCTYPIVDSTPSAWGSFDRYIIDRECSPELAKYHGWYPSRSAGDKHLRIIIPAPWSDGTPYWQARCISDGVFPRYRSANAPRGDGIVIVYPSPLSSPPTYVIVEGPIDALALAGCGVVGIGLMGNTPSAVVWDRIKSLVSGHRVLVYPDSDAVTEAAEWLTQLRARGIIAEYCVPVGKDFADLPFSRRQEVVLSWAQK